MKAGHRQFGRDMKTAKADQSMSAAARAAGAASSVYYYYGIASAGPA
jgi:hypothetical protein